MNPKCLISGVRESIEMFRKAHATPLSIGPREHIIQVVWKPPTADSFKVNWDASIDRWKNLMGVGVIIRDHVGSVLAAQCSVQKYILDPTTIEAIGAKLGAELGQIWASIPSF